MPDQFLPGWLPFIGAAGPLASILRRYRWSVPLIIAGGVLSSLREGIGSSLLAPLLATMMPSGNLVGAPWPLRRLAELADVFGERYRLLMLAGAILALVLLKATVQSSNAIFLAWVDTRIGHDIRASLSQRILGVGYKFFLGHDPGRLVTVVGTDSWRVSDAIRMSFSLLVAGTALTVFGVLMALVSWKLLAGIVVGTSSIRLLQVFLVRRLHALGAAFTAANTVLANCMLLGVDAARLIRLFGQEEREQRRFAQASDRVRQLLFEIERASVFVAPTLEVVQTALFTGVLLSAAGLGIPMPVIVAFLVLLYRAEPHLRSLSQARLSLASLRNSVREVEWLLAAETPPAPLHALAAEQCRGAVRFEGVTFVYPNRPGAAPALRAVSFELREGISTALIGRSGSGKSTVVNMLCGFLTPTAGVIRVGEVDLADIDMRSWRRQIRVAGQDIDLIEGTVAENIAYGLPEASRAEVERAAGLANIDGFIRALPDGYDTRVGARGLSLSGGQRQRIGVARAVIYRPRLLILDEATNAVDGASEGMIMALLGEHLRGVTTLVISHHAATLAACEDAILMEEGRVVEVGRASASWAARDMSAIDTFARPVG